MRSKNEIVLYQANDSSTIIEVNIADETIWLSQQQIVELFDSSKANISEHIKNIFLSGELNEISVVRNFRTTASDGKNYNVKHYNLDVQIGARIKDLGRKWFAFTNIEGFTNGIVHKLKGGGCAEL